jgi:hypothetical protein
MMINLRKPVTHSDLFAPDEIEEFSNDYDLIYCGDVYSDDSLVALFCDRNKNTQYYFCNSAKTIIPCRLTSSHWSGYEVNEQFTIIGNDDV